METCQASWIGARRAAYLVASKLHQVTSRQVAIAASSRSAARCTGTCGVYPIRCSRYDVPRSVEQAADQRGDRSSVHRWSSAQLQAAGPWSTAASSRASCAGPSRQTAPPAPLDASATVPLARQRRRH